MLILTISRCITVSPRLSEANGSTGGVESVVALSAGSL